MRCTKIHKIYPKLYQSVALVSFESRATGKSHKLSTFLLTSRGAQIPGKGFVNPLKLFVENLPSRVKVNL